MAPSTEIDDDGEASVAQAHRLSFIIDAYISALAENPAAGVDIVSESFLYADIDRSRSVRGDINSSAARSTFRDAGLADLVRREQDSQKQARALLGTLTNEYALPSSPRRVKRIYSLKSAVVELRGARRALLKEIESKFPDYGELINPKPATISETQANLHPGEALVAFYTGEERTFVWAVPKSGAVKFAEIGLGRNDLQQIVSALRSSLDPGAIATLGDIPPFDVTAAYNLYAKLLKPVEAGWKNARSLVVVSDGPLGQLPFSLLPTKSVVLKKDNGQLFAGYRTVPWLARTHAISVLPSVASLKALRGTRVAQKEQRPFIGFGDPFFNKRQQLAAQTETASVQLASRGVALRSAPQTRKVDSAEIGRLPRLPDTRTEIESIARVMQADPNRDVYLGKRANEETVKSLDLSPYKVISFATHGLVPGDLNGLNQPALALSSPKVTGGKGDGLLTMEEILGLRLNADWVVLSACNTASADGAGAEAVSGLGRAFFYAGAKSLLVSHWPVHSGATTELMTDLFQRQGKNFNLSRAEALRQTRLHMIDKGTAGTGGETAFSYAHPIFWAPFSLVGDGGGGKPAS